MIVDVLIEYHFSSIRNDGICIEMNSTVFGNNGSIFYCECTEGYQGGTCQLKLDLCANITCANKGVCKTIAMVWKCMCLSEELYYGDRCQYQTGALKVKEAMSRSFASVAITAIVLTCTFVISMDVLKYVFHIDPVKIERQKVRQKKRDKAQSHVPRAPERFQYVP